MFSIGKYTIMIVKKEDKKPVDLHKQISKQEQLEQMLIKNNRKINIILIITLMLLMMALCFILVPPTHGFYHW